MRVGDFDVEVVAANAEDVREQDSGHVLARAGTVYGLGLRNHGPLRCVSEVTIDGKVVTAAGLVLDPYSVVTLERPIDATETGRFTVVAEGDERVFGPDGGRDNPDLGSIEARFRRELPRDASRPDGPRPLPETPTRPFPIPHEPFDPPRIAPAPGRPMAPPEWTPISSVRERPPRPDISAIASALPSRVSHVERPPFDLIERAAGTGLTGHSAQRFVPAFVGPLEKEATVIRLRLVIGTDDAFTEPRAASRPDNAPVRPAARP